MKIPLIKLKNKENETEFLLTDINPLFSVIEKEGSITFFDLLYADETPYTFAQGSEVLTFESIENILKLYKTEEVDWMQDPELGKEFIKIIDSFHKFEIKIEDMKYEKNQLSLKSYFESKGVKIREDNDISIFPEKKVNVAEWKKLTGLCYKIANGYVQQSISKEQLNIGLKMYLKPLEPYMIEIANIYYDYCSKVILKEKGEIEINKIKSKYCIKEVY